MEKIREVMFHGGRRGKTNCFAVSLDGMVTAYIPKSIVPLYLTKAAIFAEQITFIPHLIKIAKAYVDLTDALAEGEREADACVHEQEEILELVRYTLKGLA